MKSLENKLMKKDDNALRRCDEVFEALLIKKKPTIIL